MGSINLKMTRQDELELDERIRAALKYLPDAKIANYLGVSLYRIEDVRQRARKSHRRTKPL